MKRFSVIPLVLLSTLQIVAVAATQQRKPAARKTSLAALTESVVAKNTTVHISRYVTYNMTQALARSNNQYFNILGTRLGFDKVHHYAQMLGFGEKAGLDIDGEQPGVLPEAAPSNGVGMMTSFGSGISMTPLELAALLSAIS